ncbi:hypothetical protein [Mangrovicoccus algicola]|uniref:Transglycosylase SLT domain-containing protein n=1 Tax=Mangrovicoccus algicola TaxID=2771008 RepID=A0A8J6Z7P5_9RHOB|nr:hypothetical protein [Mangrovicoccus algicola]MBE3637361.1 hypothetical protein [Mangrovicoccus algicola]
MEEYRDLLNFIYRAENGGRVNYDVVYGGIRAEHRPPKPITGMSVRELLAWQEKVNPHYNSEAAGALQLMPATLRSLLRDGTAKLDDTFSPETQDRYAVALMRRRGLDKWQGGRMSTEEFGNSLAKEWASLPVLAPTFRGNRRIERGQAYYGGVGANHSRALVGVEDFEALLSGRPRARKSTSGGPDAPAVPGRTPGVQDPPPPSQSWGEAFEAAYRTERPDAAPVDVWDKPDVDLTPPGELLPPQELPDVDYSTRTGKGGGPVAPLSAGQVFVESATDSAIVRSAQMQWLARQHEFDPDFDVAAAIGSDGMAGFARYLSKAQNAEHYEALKKQIRREEIRTRRADQYDGWMVPLAGGIFNPDNIPAMLVPGGLALRGGGAALRGAGVAAASSFALDAPMEAVRAENDPLSSRLESQLNVGLSMAISAGIGGYLNRNGRRATARQVNLEWRDYAGSHPQAERLGLDVEDAPALPGPAQARLSAPQDAEGAAAYDRIGETRREMHRSEANFSTDKPEDGQAMLTRRGRMLARMVDGPFKRLNMTSMTRAVKGMADDLANDGGMARADGTPNGPSVWMRSRVWHGEVDGIYRRETEIFERYLGFEKNPEVAGIHLNKSFRRKRASGEEALSIEDFRRRASRALITGQQDEIPEVNEMAGHLRDSWKRYERDGVDAGVLSTRASIQARMDKIRDRIERLDKKEAEGKELSEKQRQDRAVFRNRLRQFDARREAEDVPEDYFTRVWRPAAIRDNREAFLKYVLIPHLEKNPESWTWVPSKDHLHRELNALMARNPTQAQIDAMHDRIKQAPDEGGWQKFTYSQEEGAVRARAEEIVETLLGDTDNDLAHLGALTEEARPSFGRMRQLNMPNAHLLKEHNGIADFIETDYMHVAKAYADRMGPAIEMARRYGAPNEGISAAEGFHAALSRAQRDEFRAFLRAEKGDAPLSRTEAMDLIEYLRGQRPAWVQLHTAMGRMQKEAKQAIRDAGLDWTDFAHMLYTDPAQAGSFRAGNAADPVSVIGVDPFGATPIETFNHEFIHALKAAGKFSTGEWNAMVDLGRRLSPLFDLSRYTSADADEEAVANLFPMWAALGGDQRAISLMEEAAGVKPAFSTLLGSGDAGMALQALKAFRPLGTALRTEARFNTHWAPMERDILHLRDRVQNRVIRNPDRWDNRAATFLRNYANLAFMGQSALPAVQDLGTLVMRHGLGRTFQHAFGKLDDELAQVVKAGGEEMRKAGGILDVIEGVALSKFSDPGMDASGLTAPERWSRVLSNRYFAWNGLASLTARVKEIDAGMRVTDTLDRIHRVAGGFGTEADLRELGRYGITPDDAKRIATEPAARQEGGHWLANTDAWKDRENVMKFRALIRQGSENAVLMATAADKPIIADGTVYLRRGPRIDPLARKAGLEVSGDYWQVQSGLLTLPFSFWSFAFAAHTKILSHAVDDPTARNMAGVASLVGLGYMVASFRDGDSWDRREPEEKLFRAINQSGVLGVLPQVLAIGEQPTGYDMAMRAAGAGPDAASNLVHGIGTGDMMETSWGLPFRNHLLIKDWVDQMVDRNERGIMP